MSGLMHVLLALLTIASALAVVLARRQLGAGLALGLNMASLAGIALTLSAPLVAIGLFMMGLGIALASLEAFARNHGDEPPGAPTDARAWLGSEGAGALAIRWFGVVLLVALAGALLAGDAPGWRIWIGGGPRSEEAIPAVLRALYTRYGLGLAGAGLVMLAALIGVHGRRDAH